MSADELAALKADWRGISRDTAGVAERFAQHRGWRRRSRLLAATGFVAVAVCLIWAASIAIERRAILYAVAAVAFTAALPIILAGLLQLHRNIAPEHEQTSFDLLLRARERLGAKKMNCDSAVWSAAILFTALLAVWGLVLAHQATIGSAVRLSLLWGPSAIALLVWRGRRHQRLARQIAACERLLGEFD